MSEVLRINLETYREAMNVLTNVNALGESNRYLVECVLIDINNLLRYAIYNTDTPGESLATEVAFNGVAQNQETLDNDRINDINYAAGMLATDILGGILQVADFYSRQIDVGTMRFNELRLGTGATVRIEFIRMFDIDEEHAPDASRLVSGFFMLYRCSGEQSRELRNELRGTVAGYIGTSPRDD